MSHFIGSLKLRALPPEEVKLAKSPNALFEVTEDFIYVSDLFGTIVVKAGFITDFASIPAFARWWIDGDAPEILYPSVVHDWAYKTKFISRIEADTLIKEAMIVCDAGTIHANVVFNAVRLGGGSHW